jgi:hypothetical protein
MGNLFIRCRFWYLIINGIGTYSFLEQTLKNKKMKKYLLCCSLLVAMCGTINAQIQNNANSNHANKFEQLGTILPTPNEQRTASGAPGTKYWQQRVDYDIKCELDEANNKACRG